MDCSKKLSAGGFPAAKLLFYLVQFTWGLPVNLIGAALWLALFKGHKHERFKNAFVTYVPGNMGGISLGLFIFISADKEAGWTSDTRIHEYGHTVQCLILGPLYLPVILLPSAVWYNFFDGYRKRKHISYYRLFCESQADRLGASWSGMKLSRTNEKKGEKQ